MGRSSMHIAEMYSNVSELHGIETAVTWRSPTQGPWDFDKIPNIPWSSQENQAGITIHDAVMR